MNKKIVWSAILVSALLVGYAGRYYIGLAIVRIDQRYFRPEFYQRAFKIMQSILIVNDLNESIFFESINDGKRKVDWVDSNSNGGIFDTQGEVRIFVPERRGWYTVEYPYPYPLTEQREWDMVGPRVIAVKMSDLMDAIQSGEVVCYTGHFSKIERLMVKDIKVTFEPGEGPRMTVEDRNRIRQMSKELKERMPADVRNIFEK